MQNSSNTLTLHYEIHSSTAEHAQWILFIHGAGGSTRTWRKQIDTLKEKFNLLLIDLPGHSQSREATLDQPHYDFEWIGNKIWEVVDTLKLARIHIVAVSIGSIIAMQMQHNRPDRIWSMVFAGPIVALNLKLRILARTGLALAKVIGYQSFYALTAKLTLPRKNHKKSREIFVRESKFISDVEYKKWTAMYGKTLDETLLRLFGAAPAVPLYFLIGSQDHLFRQPAVDYARPYPNVTVDIVAGCGHLVSLEKSLIFNEKCLKYLNKG